MYTSQRKRLGENARERFVKMVDTETNTSGLATRAYSKNKLLRNIYARAFGLENFEVHSRNFYHYSS